MNDKLVALDLERNVLAGVMLDPGQWFDAAEHVHRESFYAESHRLIWDALAGLQASGTPQDLELVAGWLRDHGTLAQCGGVAYLAGLQGETMVAAYTEHYARAVAEKYALRQLFTAGNRIAQTALNDDLNASQAYSEASQVMLEAAPGKAEAVGADVLSSWREVYEAGKRKASDPNARVVNSGLVDLDRALTSFDPGQLIVLAARPGVGKSALALQISLHNVRRGLTVDMFSLEMIADEDRYPTPEPLTAIG